MTTYGVTQRLYFCYGHRLLDHPGPCGHLHGHNATAELSFETTDLTIQGMVLDFGEIKRHLKTWLDETIDHKLLLCKNDPLFPVLSAMGEPIYAMENNPTAENIAKMIYDRARQQDLPVVSVKVWETPNQCACYKA